MTASSRERARLRLRDNPLLVAQSRRRLRRRQAIPLLAIVIVLGICGVAGAASASRPVAWRVLEASALALMSFVLLLRGTLQVAGTIADERDNGLLDFHRATPTTPLTDALGYMVGPAAREYLALAALTPFVLIASLARGGNPLAALGGVAALLLCGWMYHAMALAIGLSGLNRRGVTGVAVMMVIGLGLAASPVYLAGLHTFAFLTPLPALASLQLGGLDLLLGQTLPVFGLRVHALLWTVVVQGALLLFLLQACARQIRREGTPPFPRPGAFVFHVVLVLLVIGGLWRSFGDPDARAMILVGYLWGSAGLAGFLAASLAPSYLLLVRTTRRARRAGRARPGWLEDGGPGAALILVWGALLAAGYGLIAATAGSGVSADAVFGVDAALAVAAGAAFVAFAAGAVAYARLAMRAAWRGIALLIGFLTLVLPWIAGAILDGAGMEGVSEFVIGLSPAYALGASALRLADLWGYGVTPVDLGPVAFSVAVTLVMALAFHTMARRVRLDLEELVPMTGP